MCWNDLIENIDEQIYTELTYRYGRRFDGHITLKRSDLFYRVSSYTRSKIADNLSISTYAYYSFINTLNRFRHDFKYGINQDRNRPFIKILKSL